MNRLATWKLKAVIYFLFLLLAGPGYSQTKPQSGVFEPVPEALRQRLRERLNSFVEAYSTEQWSKLYDLLTDDFNVGTREEFIKSRFETPPPPIDVLIGFTPQRANYDDSSKVWEITGCSKWGKRGELAAAVFAYRLKDDWYFSTIALDLVIKTLPTGWSTSINDTITCKDSSNQSSGAQAFH